MANCFMDTHIYEANKHFERNEAIYILHTIDKKTLEEIAENFQLALEEIQKILVVHAEYEKAAMGKII